MKKITLVEISGDWNDGDLLKETVWMNEAELEKFLAGMEKVKKMYDLYREYEKDVRDLWELFSNIEDRIYETFPEEIRQEFTKEDIDEIARLIDTYVPVETESGCGCHSVSVYSKGTFEVPDDFDPWNFYNELIVIE